MRNLHCEVRRAQKFRKMGKMVASIILVGTFQSHNMISVKENDLRTTGL